jgi:carbonic anhydrase
MTPKYSMQPPSGTRLLAAATAALAPVWQVMPAKAGKTSGGTFSSIFSMNVRPVQPPNRRMLLQGL